MDGINAHGAVSMFILTVLEKIKEARLKFSQGSVTVLQKTLIKKTIIKRGEFN